MEQDNCSACDTPPSIYEYEPLIAEDSVRILNLEPANDFQAPLRGYLTQSRLTVESLDPGGCRYSAVSYTWGDRILSHELSLRLGTTLALLPITKNADLLLRYLRDTLKEKVLWIDGVCINQWDQGEKAHQIPLMGQIYTNARKVHIWLGVDEIEEAERAFSLIRRIEVDESLRPTAESNDFLCLERFFNRPWFFRRWVIQEIFFAHDAVLRCGHHTLSLSRVMTVLQRNADPSWDEPPGWGSKMLQSITGVYSSYWANVLALLWSLHESECSDKRDRIAAVYSMADAEGRPPLHYDIGDWKSMYMAIASYYLNNSTDRAYEVLHHLCGFGSIKPSTDNEIPSWVPNWSTKLQPRVPYGRAPDWMGRDSLKKRSRCRFSYDRITRPKQWKQAREWYEKRLGLAIHTSPMKIEGSERRLRLNFDFLSFIHGCGIVDQVVFPALSEDFWEEVVGLIRWQEKIPDMIKDRFRSNNAVYQAKKRHEMELQSLSLLMISILEETGARAAGVHVRGLCAGLYSRHGYGRGYQDLTDYQKELLQEIRSAVKNFALLRVQATLGYYWAIGPPDLAKGDWLVPLIPDIGAGLPQSTYEQITTFMALRPIGAEGRGSTWYPSPTSDPEDRLRRLVGSTMTGVDSIHVNARFVGSGGSCIHSFDYGLSRDTVVWRIFRRANNAAEKRNLPGPVIFDII